MPQVCTKSISSTGTGPECEVLDPAPPWDALLTKASAQCWGFNQTQEREVKEACGGP